MADTKTHTSAGSGSARETRALWSEVLENRGFLVCAGMLLVMTVGFNAVARKKGINFNPLPVPLRKQLAQLDQTALSPYKQLKVQTIQADVLNALGTDQYVQWVMADPYLDDGTLSPSARSSEWASTGWPRMFNLFVTYYTGIPDPVPHVPEACLEGSGYDLVESRADSVEIDTIHGKETVPIRVGVFDPPGKLGGQQRIVVYTFHANGGFRDGRLGVLRAFGTSKYLYFSKLELAFDIGRGYPNEEAIVAAAKRVLRVVGPVLVERHWPDWEAVAAESPSPSPTDTDT